MDTERGPAPAGEHVPGGWLTPGVMLGQGRYRLLERVGTDAACGATLWRGRDTVLERDVALTVFLAEPGDEEAIDALASVTRLALRGARLESPGTARVLDVLEPEHGPQPATAAVVAEWTAGRDLIATVRAGLPSPSRAAHMLGPLAGTVDDAHRAGLVLGCDHPGRIKICADGHARLAFPGPAVDTEPRNDVQGLGAALYLLLTGRWPLPDGPDELPVAPRDQQGELASPRSLRPTVPLQLSALALRSLGGSGAAGLRTGAAVQRMLHRGSAEAPAGETSRGNGAPADESVWHEFEAGPRQAPERRRKLRLAIAALVLAVLAVLGWVGWQVTTLLIGDSNDPAVVIRPHDESGQRAGGRAGTAWSTDSYPERFPA